MNDTAAQSTVIRERLPNRRASENFDLELEGIRYSATVGFYPDGRAGEIFMSSHKAGSGANVVARDTAIAISFALQFGVKLEHIAHAMSRKGNGTASGQLGTLLDLLAAESNEG